MSQNFNFEHLAELCQTAHEDMQNRAHRSVNSALVIRNWLFGWYITEFGQKGVDRAKYGATLIELLSETLRNRLGKGFSTRNLEMFRKFYQAYPISQTVSAESAGKPRAISQTASAESAGKPGAISQTASAEFTGKHFHLISPGLSVAVVDNSWQQLTGQLANNFSLSWSHYVSLLTLDEQQERRFYEIEATANSWSVRELERQIASSLYERLALSRDKEAVKQLSKSGLIIQKPADLIKDPVILEFLELENKPIYSETDLEGAVINKLQGFLLELGKGFLFEARQRRITLANDHYYVDLVLYNRMLHCYVLIDFKRGKLSHQDLGQMQMYVNYFDRDVKEPEEAPTVGILLCHQKNDALVELTLPEEHNIYASQYKLYLPSKEELKTKLLRITEEIATWKTDTNRSH